MARKVSDLLEAMRRSKNNWTRKDLEDLYIGFGFRIRVGEKHDIAIHRKYPQLRGNLPNHKSFAKGYISSAVRLIDQLKELEIRGGKNGK